MVHDTLHWFKSLLWLINKKRLAGLEPASSKAGAATATPQPRCLSSKDSASVSHWHPSPCTGACALPVPRTSPPEMRRVFLWSPSLALNLPGSHCALWWLRVELALLVPTLSMDGNSHAGWSVGTSSGGRCQESAFHPPAP